MAVASQGTNVTASSSTARPCRSQKAGRTSSRWANWKPSISSLITWVPTSSVAMTPKKVHRHGCAESRVRKSTTSSRRQDGAQATRNLLHACAEPSRTAHRAEPEQKHREKRQEHVKGDGLGLRNAARVYPGHRAKEAMPETSHEGRRDYTGGMQRRAAEIARRARSP